MITPFLILIFLIYSLYKILSLLSNINENIKIILKFKQEEKNEKDNNINT